MSSYDATQGPWSKLAPRERPWPVATPPAPAPATVSPRGPAGSPAAPLSAAFSGEPKEFIRLCLRAGFFTVVTLGLYRFWFLTDVRRFLWRHTRLGSDSLEYRGTGRELLLGFLFALAILGPLYLGYFLLGIEAERYQAFASTPFFLILMLFGIYASYRARRYRLTRTVFRGARFWMTGSGFIYLLRYLGWGFLALVTLGLAYPWMQASLERYKMRNTFYGDLRGGFAGRGSTFFKRGILLWLLTVPPLFAIIMALGAISGDGPGQAHSLDRDEKASELLVIALVYAPIAVMLIGVMKGIEWRWWVEGLRFGAARASSTLGAWFLVKEYLKFGLVSLGALVVCGLAGAAAIGIGREITGPLPPIHIGSLTSLLRLPTAFYVMAALALAAYLGLFILMGAIYRRFLLFGVWRKVVGTLTVHEAQVFDNVTVAGTPSGVIGEALADALDFGF
jgi:uncharacterized membrane protein YjgN (DUF898 family)